jgi:hypothetical protein
VGCDALEYFGYLMLGLAMRDRYAKVGALLQEVVHFATSLIAAFGHAYVGQLKNLIAGVHVNEVAGLALTKDLANLVFVVFAHCELVKEHVLGARKVSHLFKYNQ